MSIEPAFWVCMLLWLILGAAKSDRTLSGIGGSLLPFLAVPLLGWSHFGAPLHG